MAEITNVGLAQEVRTFGWRVFRLADSASAADSCVRHAAGAAQIDAGMLSRLRKSAALASRHLARRGTAIEVRVAVHEAQKAFKRLNDAVSALDELAAAAPEMAVDASALAAEATSLADRIYDLVEVA